MSPFRMTEVLRVYLGPEGTATAMCSGLRPRIVSTGWHASKSGNWTDILNSIDNALMQAGKSLRVELRLATPLVRLALMPFDDATADPAIEMALAQTIIEHTYGIDTATTPVRIGLSPARFGKTRCITAFDASRALQLEDIVASRGHRLCLMSPIATRIFDAAQPAFGGNCGTLVIAEADRLLLIDHDGNQPVTLRFRPLATHADIDVHTRDTMASVVAPGRRIKAGDNQCDARLVMMPTSASPADPRVFFAICGGYRA